MKKLLLAFVLTATMSQAFAAAAFLASLHDKTIALGGMLTSTTVSVFASPLAGLIVFADNGEAYLDLEATEAMDTLMIAVDKSINGEELTDLDVSIIDIYATAKGVSHEELVSEASLEL